MSADATARYLVGDTRTVLASMPDASVDLVLTSPPFLGLRSYLPADDPAKAQEIGGEDTPGEFLDALLDVVEECRRVLAPHGSICFELGDTYAGGGQGPDERYTAKAGVATFHSTKRWTGDRGPRGGAHRALSDQGGGHHLGGDGWPLDKSLCLVPELFRFALVYGFNPLTGRTTPRWRARNVVRWCRPNPPVGALADKVRPATSDMVIACVDRKRYFDLDAVRGPGSPNTHARTAAGVDVRPSTGKTADDERRGGNFSTLATLHDTNGAPPLDHWWHDEDTFDQDAWLISTEAYPGSHYATWPQALVEKPIKAMCPLRVCTVCGSPSERIVESQRTLDGKPADLPPLSSTEVLGAAADGIGHWRKGTSRMEIGWTDCGHNSWRAGVVLDPFAGSGTTLAVAFGHGRSSIGIDLDERNADLARQRVGMWLEVEHPHLAGSLEGPLPR